MSSVLPGRARGLFLGQSIASLSEPSRADAARSGRLRRSFVLLALFLLAAVAISTPKSEAQGFGENLRVVLGKVVDPNETPQANAIVYLQNLKSGEIRTYITIPDGSFRFGQLSSDVDYKIWARLQGRKSKARTISSFDSKKLFSFDLKLEPAK